MPPSTRTWPRPASKVGDHVERGQWIGRVGNTGNASAEPPQLHFELRAPFRIPVREGGRDRRIDAFDPLPSLRAGRSQATGLTRSALADGTIRSWQVLVGRAQTRGRLSYQHLPSESTTNPAPALADRTVSIALAARILGVHPNTVRTWTEQGRLPVLRINARGDRRYRVSDLEAFLAAAQQTPRSARPTIRSRPVRRGAAAATSPAWRRGAAESSWSSVRSRG